MLTILTGDALEQLRTLPTESVQCCCTSPPYWGLRDYGTAAWKGGVNGCDHAAPIESGANGNKSNSQTHPGRFVDCKCGAKRIDSQLGLEKTPEEYVAKMIEVFREVRRVLRPDGTVWLNLGDSYAGTPVGTFNGGGFKDSSARSGGRDLSGISSGSKQSKIVDGLKPKDLCGIPWRVAFALQADGWWLRSDIIWAKPNPMPESVTDRPTKAHEYLFLLTKSANYFYDAEAIKEKATWFEERPNGMQRLGEQYRDKVKGKYEGAAKYGGGGTSFLGHSGNLKADGTPISNGNKRSVWTVATAPYPEAHFATYPPDLIKPCILAGTSAKGAVPSAVRRGSGLWNVKHPRTHGAIESSKVMALVQHGRSRADAGM